ncbi:ribosomal protein S18-alanine N-acetyltransferase [Vagococcus jeotgali]|uniref:ribosomal protein S18-alanine N-acetyltransferase n=1 Tax=Vagococcus jeotgali TaxID=3109030 RepID=UPI002DD9E17D|nr:ribosomal protein S18-alanine N-acetyltransferase [Vagococcus sp. B2T-5]
MQIKEVTVERAKVSDILSLQKILKEVYAGKSPWSTTVFWVELSKKKYGCYLKAIYQDEIIGFAGIRVEVEDAHITNIAVSTKYQSKAVGRLLLDQLKLEAKELDCYSMSLEVRASNSKAISMYKKYGFKQMAIKKEYYKDGKEDAVEMFMRI